MRLIACTVIALFLASCAYKIDVQQGNFVTNDLVAKLKTGMTRAEVKGLLGTPLLNDIFHANRWDYYFSNVKGRKAQDRTELSIYFEDDKVVRFTGGGNKPLPAETNPQYRTVPKGK